MMARVMYVYSIDEVAKRIGESLELIKIVSWNDDNIDYEEMISVYNSNAESFVTFTERGIESLQDLPADLRTWEGGIRQFLIDEECDPDVIEAVMAYEKNARCRRVLGACLLILNQWLATLSSKQKTATAGLAYWSAECTLIHEPLLQILTLLRPMASYSLILLKALTLADTIL